MPLPSDGAPVSFAVMAHRTYNPKSFGNDFVFAGPKTVLTNNGTPILSKTVCVLCSATPPLKAMHLTQGRDVSVFATQVQFFRLQHSALSLCVFPSPPQVAAKNSQIRRRGWERGIDESRSNYFCLLDMAFLRFYPLLLPVFGVPCALTPPRFNTVVCCCLSLQTGVLLGCLLASVAVAVVLTVARRAPSSSPRHTNVSEVLWLARHTQCTPAS